MTTPTPDAPANIAADSDDSKMPKPRRSAMSVLTGGSVRMRPLADDALACRSCGVEVGNPEPDAVESLRAGAYWFSIGGQPRPVGLPFIEVEVTRCGECAGRWERAQSLVQEQGVDYRLGNVADDYVDAALAALDAVGIRGKHVEPLTRTRAQTLALVRALAFIGNGMRFDALISPTLRISDSQMCAARRWSHVEADSIAAARAAYGEMVSYRLEKVEPQGPPSDGLRGCLLCGVPHVLAKASDARAAWGRYWRVQPGTLGGRTRPHDVSGYLCPTCRANVGDGALGTPAVERAVLAALGFRVQIGGDVRFNPGMALPWVALSDGTPPNAEPWAHLDRARLTAALERALHVRRIES